MVQTRTRLQAAFTRTSGSGEVFDEIPLTAGGSAHTVLPTKRLVVVTGDLEAGGPGDYHVFLAATGDDTGAHTSVLRTLDGERRISTLVDSPYGSLENGWKLWVKSQGNCFVRAFLIEV